MSCIIIHNTIPKGLVSLVITDCSALYTGELSLSPHAPTPPIEHFINYAFQRSSETASFDVYQLPILFSFGTLRIFCFLVQWYGPFIKIVRYLSQMIVQRSNANSRRDVLKLTFDIKHLLMSATVPEDLAMYWIYFRNISEGEVLIRTRPIKPSQFKSNTFVSLCFSGILQKHHRLHRSRS